MNEGRLWLMLNMLPILAVAAGVFGFLGWWVRGWFSQEAAYLQSQMDVQALRQRLVDTEAELRQREGSLRRLEAESANQRAHAPEAVNAELDTLRYNLAQARREIAQATADLADAETRASQAAEAYQALEHELARIKADSAPLPAQSELALEDLPEATGETPILWKKRATGRQ